MNDYEREFHDLLSRLLAAIVPPTGREAIRELIQHYRSTAQKATDEGFGHGWREGYARGLQVGPEQHHAAAHIGATPEPEPARPVDGEAADAALLARLEADMNAGKVRPS